MSDLYLSCSRDGGSDIKGVGLRSAVFALSNRPHNLSLSHSELLDYHARFWSVGSLAGDQSLILRYNIMRVPHALVFYVAWP